MKEYPTSSIEFFEHADGKIYDVCQAYYLHYLKPSTTSEEAAKKLREFYEACGFIQSDQTLKIETITSPNVFQELMDTNRVIIEKIVDNLIKQNVGEDEFYNLLWEQMQNEVLFPSEDSIVAFMIQLLFDPQLPYYHLPPVEMMDDDDYMESIQRIKVDYQKALFAINYGYAQKTQMAEQILNIATEIESSQERIVLVSNIFGYYKNQIDNLENEIDQLKNQINNAEENKKNETTV